MENDRDFLRDRLLGRAPRTSDLADYRQFILSAVEKDQKRIRRDRILATLFWIFCAASATAWLWFSADSAHLPRGPFLAGIFFTWGGVELVKHHIDACRIDLLKGIKQIQLQLFEREAAPRESGNL
jgi:hypothetical protein